MKRLIKTVLLGCMVLLGACGEPIRAIDADANAAKSQARDAVRAAEDAARRVEEMSRAASDQPTNSQ